EVVNKVKERAHEIRLVFEKLLQEGIEKQEIRPLNVQSMSFTLFSLVESLILQISFAEEMTPVKSLKSVNILLNGLRA
ncbi:MAG TPA: TetR/AcrR family transcriptional regulator, partial [Firmicutes bacterium]|nr:TetR/AcrR family transcriptional regulator [Bacillota bacterium]